MLRACSRVLRRTLAPQRWSFFISDFSRSPSLMEIGVSAKILAEPTAVVLWTELQLSQQPKDQIERCNHFGERFPKVIANFIVPCGRLRALQRGL